MSSHRVPPRRLALAAGAAIGLLFVTAPPAWAAPRYDSQGYVDSTARCAAPETVVVFGSTAGSRVAICRDGDGDFEYRGVRVRDGARLITSATRSADGAFTASSSGIDYLVTSEALVISAGEKVLRDEPMVDFHRAGPSSTSGSTSTSGPSPSPTERPTPTTPLPPPLPAEVGAEGS
jgi:hypothetical protein